MRINILIVCALLALCGCATPRVDQAKLSTTTTKSRGANSVFYKSILVQPSAQGNQQNVIEAALQSSLQNIDWSSTSYKSKYVISVAVAEEKPPKAGFSQSGSLTVWYTLKERSTGSVISSDRIFSSSEMGLMDEFVGRKRVVLVQEEYIRKNIQSYLARLNAIGELEKGRENNKNRTIAKATIEFQSDGIISRQSIFDADPQYNVLNTGDKKNILDLTSPFWMSYLKKANLADAQNFISNYQTYINASDLKDAERIISSKRVDAKRTNPSNRQSQSQEHVQLRPERTGF